MPLGRDLARPHCHGDENNSDVVADASFDSS